MTLCDHLHRLDYHSQCALGDWLPCISKTLNYPAQISTGTARNGVCVSQHPEGRGPRPLRQKP
jgi:hypothetical protein